MSSEDLEQQNTGEEPTEIAAELVSEDGTELPEAASDTPEESRRQEIKALVAELSERYPDLKSKVFGAMQRLPLDGWEPNEYARRPLP